MNIYFKIMKQIILLLIALLSFSAQSQNKFDIEHCKDAMTGEEYFMPIDALLGINKEKTKGFSVLPNFKSINSVVTQDGLMCQAVNIGGCVENSSLIFLFLDDTKITITSWNKFNCDGNAYFYLTDSEYKELSTKKIKSIRFTNGRSFESLTHIVTEIESNYFISAYTNQKIVEVSCD